MRFCNKAVRVFYLLFFTIFLFNLNSCTREEKEANYPKYIFLFIGDGMGYSQIQLTSDYLGTVAHVDDVKPEKLSFQCFPISGTVTNYDLVSYIPDSASSGSGIASGEKIRTGTINYASGRILETVAEKLKKQKNYKVGIVSSVNINHTTPADFYAHQESRKNEYEIGEELIESGFDYFAGGGFRCETGREGTQESLLSLSQKAGFTILQTKEQLENFQGNGEKVIVIPEQLDDVKALPYCIDQVKESVSLNTLVEIGSTLLDNKNGFFMMVEGGKIDWACHQNDTATCIQEVVAFHEAVQSAVQFYTEHPDETLILVTADHETGGLSLGYATTNYSLYLENLQKQQLSYESFCNQYVQKYRKEQTDFEEAMKDVEENFGLSSDKQTIESSEEMLILSHSEITTLKKAYEVTLEFGSRKQCEMTEEEYRLYGSNDPFTMTILHILANKSGIDWSTYAHTGDCVPVYALGLGQEEFIGNYDNTEIFNKIATLTNID